MLRLTCPEACLIVPEFTSSVCGGSCNSLFFCTYYLFFSFSDYFLAYHPTLAIQQNRKQQTDNDAKKAETYKNCRTHKY